MDTRRCACAAPVNAINAALLPGVPEAGSRSTLTVSAIARTWRFRPSGITRASFACALSTAGAASARPSPRAATMPTDSATASSLVNIIGGSLKPATSM